MFDKEQELVEIGLHSYNLKEGGYGGWNHINGLPKENRPNLIKIKQMIENGDFVLGGTVYWTEESRKKVIDQAFKNIQNMNEKSRSEDSKRKRKETFSQIKHSQGEKNSQYGRYWITNIESKETKRIEKDEIIPDGWIRGKTIKMFKTCWVNNGKIETIIPLHKIDEYSKNEFIRGRLKSLLQNSIKIIKI